MLARELKTAFNCKTVATIHYTKWQNDLHGNLSRFRMLKAKPEEQQETSEQRKLTFYEYEGAMFREVDRVIALSRYMQNIPETDYQLDPSRIAIIPNGLQDSEQLSMNSEQLKIGNYPKDSLRKKWRISDKEKLILFAGRLNAVKGLVYLVRAFRKVLETMPGCRLMIAGNGSYDLCLQSAQDICTKITFAGFLEKNALYELYRIADIGVVPSLYEPFGYVAIEMMMHSLPVVATATSGLNEVVDGASGIKVPVTESPDSIETDTDLLAEKMLYLLQRPDERKRMGANARARYERLYTSHVMRDNMLNFYTSLYDTENHSSGVGGA